MPEIDDKKTWAAYAKGVKPLGKNKKPAAFLLVQKKEPLRVEKKDHAPVRKREKQLPQLRQRPSPLTNVQSEIYGKAR